MEATQFCYWLNGFCEFTEGQPTGAEWRSIKEHLQTVFNKVTSPASGSLHNLPRLPNIKQLEFDFEYPMKVTC